MLKRDIRRFRNSHVRRTPDILSNRPDLTCQMGTGIGALWLFKVEQYFEVRIEYCDENKGMIFIARALRLDPLSSSIDAWPRNLSRDATLRRVLLTPEPRVVARRYPQAGASLNR